MLLLERIIGEAKILESDRTKLPDGVLCRVKEPVCNVDQLNANKRKYGWDVWEKVMDNQTLTEQMQKRALFGHAEHPATSQSDLQLVSHAILEWVIDKPGNTVYQVFDVFDTPTGRIVDCLLRAQCKVGVSTRAEGELTEEVDEKSKQKYQRVIAEKYKYITTDFTADPSTFGAIPIDVKRNVVTEIKAAANCKKATANDKKFAGVILESMHCKDKTKCQHCGCCDAIKEATVSIVADPNQSLVNVGGDVGAVNINPNPGGVVQITVNTTPSVQLAQPPEQPQEETPKEETEEQEVKDEDNKKAKDFEKDLKHELGQDEEDKDEIGESGSKRRSRRKMSVGKTYSEEELDEFDAAVWWKPGESTDWIGKGLPNLLKDDEILLRAFNANPHERQGVYIFAAKMEGNGYKITANLTSNRRDNDIDKNPEHKDEVEESKVNEAKMKHFKVKMGLEFGEASEYASIEAVEKLIRDKFSHALKSVHVYGSAAGVEESASAMLKEATQLKIDAATLRAERDRLAEAVNGTSDKVLQLKIATTKIHEMQKSENGEVTALRTKLEEKANTAVDATKKLVESTTAITTLNEKVKELTTGNEKTLEENKLKIDSVENGAKKALVEQVNKAKTDATRAVIIEYVGRQLKAFKSVHDNVRALLEKCMTIAEVDEVLNEFRDSQRRSALHSKPPKEITVRKDESGTNNDVRKRVGIVFEGFGMS